MIREQQVEPAAVVAEEIEIYVLPVLKAMSEGRDDMELRNGKLIARHAVLRVRALIEPEKLTDAEYQDALETTISYEGRL
jgi:hypothetical protein